MTRAVEGLIEPEKLYTVAELEARLGWGATARRAARRAGLRIVYVHKRGYVYGRDAIDYILRAGSLNPDALGGGHDAN